MFMSSVIDSTSLNTSELGPNAMKANGELTSVKVYVKSCCEHEGEPDPLAEVLVRSNEEDAGSSKNLRNVVSRRTCRPRQ